MVGERRPFRLKCVVTEVVLFSIVASKTLYVSQGSVATHLRCGGVFSDSIITIFFSILKRKTFENRLIFGEVKAYKMVPILDHPVGQGFLKLNHEQTERRVRPRTLPRGIRVCQ